MGIRALLSKILPDKRYFVGLITLEVRGSRFFHPPLSLDWQGSIGPFVSRADAGRYVDHFKAIESEDAATPPAPAARDEDGKGEG